MQKNFLAMKISIAGLLAAFVFIFTNIRISFKLGPTDQMIHMGDTFCVVAGLLLSPIFAGLCAGIGSFIFDILNPVFITSAPFTFIFKFIMTSVCSMVLCKVSTKHSNYFRNTIAALIGATIYIVLRLLKKFVYNVIVLQLPLKANLWMLLFCAVVSLINNVLAVFTAVPLAVYIKKVFCKSSLRAFFEN